MKIAAITDDGNTISQHFGRARYYVVLTVEGGKIVGRETRDKMGHRDFAGPAPERHDEGLGHGYGAAAQSRHARMAEAISDRQVLLSRGMGRGAYESMKEYGIRPIVTDTADIEEAARAYLDGTIVDHIEWLH